MTPLEIAKSWLYNRYLEWTSQQSAPFWLPVELVPGGKLPTRAHETDGCLDCYARIDEPIILEPGCYLKIPLGIKLAIPPGWCVKLWDKSGLAWGGANSHIATIDAGYREEIVFVYKWNQGDGFTWTPPGTEVTPRMAQHWKIVPDQKICQMSLERVNAFQFLVVDELPQEGNRNGGFGSSGLH